MSKKIAEIFQRIGTEENEWIENIRWDTYTHWSGYSLMCTSMHLFEELPEVTRRQLDEAIARHSEEEKHTLRAHFIQYQDALQWLLNFCQWLNEKNDKSIYLKNIEEGQEIQPHHLTDAVPAAMRATYQESYRVLKKHESSQALPWSLEK